jgi:hypothetical protein
MDWFRFYSETIRDSKIRRVARKAGETPAHVVGVWSILLSLASESQERGVLLLGNDPVTVDDIEDVTGCNVSVTLQEMVQVGMLNLDGEVYSIAAWGKRQYESDNSTPRVQKHRQGKKQSETLPKRYSNAPETEAETEAETETEEEPATASRSQMARQYEAVLGMVPTASYPEMTRYMDRLINASAADWWTLALQETTGARRPGWQYMKSVLEAWLAAGQPSTGSKTNGHSQDPDNRPRVKAPPADALAAADARQAAYERQVAEELTRAGRLA